MQAKSDAVAAAAVLLAEAAAAGIGGHGDGRAAGTAPAPGKDPRTAAGDVGPSIGDLRWTVDFNGESDSRRKRRVGDGRQPDTRTASLRCRGGLTASATP